MVILENKDFKTEVIQAEERQAWALRFTVQSPKYQSWCAPDKKSTEMGCTDCKL